MANKKAYSAPNAEIDCLRKNDVMNFGSDYDNIGEDFDWDTILGTGGDATL